MHSQELRILGEVVCVVGLAAILLALDQYRPADARADFHLVLPNERRLEFA